jgi:hypothetical protein
MKTLNVLLCAVFIMATVNSGMCQLFADTTLFDEMLWGNQKRRMVMEEMQLSEAEKASFWPVYESYTRAISYTEAEALHIIVACNDASYGLDQNDLERYSKRLLQNDLLLDRFRIQYYKKFAKALSASRASQFMQLDANLRMMLRIEVQNKVQGTNEAQASAR